MNTLALLGGSPVRTTPFPAANFFGEEEKAAVCAALDSGRLSGFQAGWPTDFYGGSQVRAFEEDWAQAFGVKRAITMNSATSALYAAMGAAGVGPGDEVIVSPFTMVASATAALIYNAVPVFADIDPRTYTLSPDSIRARITPRTKAIIVVDILGQAADLDPIMAIAAEHNLVVVEDAAQAPFATHKGRAVGTIAHMGVFSLNYHKHIHTGEGGLIVTNDDEMAERLALIRNHAEVVVNRKPVKSLVDMIGYNFRLGEIEAAIGRCQLKRGPELVARRQANVRYLEAKLAGYPGLTMPHVAEGNSHVYYLHVMGYDEAATGVPRDLFVKAMKAELPHTVLRESDGTLIDPGYTAPIYTFPAFRDLVGYGEIGCPFKCPHYTGTPDYRPGLCPNAERAHATIINHEFMLPPSGPAELDDVVRAFAKVADNFARLRDHAARA
jgi:dTDP-4-amino-4,6-dideoxygalactose transaminase